MAFEMVTYFVYSHSFECMHNSGLLPCLGPLLCKVLIGHHLHDDGICFANAF